ncbi:MAG: PD-(D/E)XK nuclease family protein [Gemmataceae bacterium]|nr:PD-(D/E)XK nuclease family protein [Gemmataceae bacterium]
MTLNTRDLPFEVPSYSLTGDILSFQRCPLQYRYYNGSSLPPSRPVQMWTGEFVHGVLEEAYRHWQLHHPPFPWPCNQTPWPPPPTPLTRVPHDIGVLGDLIETRLAAGGKQPRSSAARNAAYDRVDAAINLLSPHLFPLITAAEHRISGTRDMPPLPGGGQARGDRFELTGIVDVISSVVVAANLQNPLVQLIQALIAPVHQDYDLIVDYKAMRRPTLGSPAWQHQEWQVQTYAWLCRQVPQARPVGAGLLIYINELSPSRTDLVELKREFQNSTSDVLPPNGSQDYYALHQWQPAPGSALPQFSVPFRLARAIRVIDVSDPQVQHAVTQIDQVVSHIEDSAFNEHNAGNIPNHWAACGEEQDCDACDFRHFCPSPASQRVLNPPPRQPPVAPG